MNLRLALTALICLGYQSSAMAATGVSPTGSVLKMVLGLAVVLAVMALISWGVKRLMPGVAGQQSVVRIVGGASVGSRERVVVLEVAGRWIVVGVAPGQVNALANLEAGSGNSDQQIEDSISAANQTTINPLVHPIMQPLVKPFSEWLKKSTQKAKATFNEKSNAKK